MLRAVVIVRSGRIISIAASEAFPLLLLLLLLLLLFLFLFLLLLLLLLLRLRLRIGFPNRLELSGSSRLIYEPFSGQMRASDLA